MKKRDGLENIFDVYRGAVDVSMAGFWELWKGGGGGREEEGGKIVEIRTSMTPIVTFDLNRVRVNNEKSSERAL